MNILIIGGNRFFGKKLAQSLIDSGHEVTLLNRGHSDDGFGNRIKRIRCDRRHHEELETSVEGQFWDVIYDQVCFDALEAQSAVEIFKDKTSHYIFTSSQSVYSLAGSHLKEEAFDPQQYSFDKPVSTEEDYAEAKRQCESIFFRQTALPVTAVRFSIVVGLDDYTGRFRFHVERVKNRKPIYFPNINAKLSLVTSEDAASVLEFLLNKEPVGPVNAASPGPIALKDFIGEIESVTGQKALLETAASKENHSPYGIERDWYMSVDKLIALGKTPASIEEWLSPMIRDLVRDV